MTQRREHWGLIAYDRRTLAGCMSLLREAVGRRVKRCVQRFKTLLVPRWEGQG